MCPNTALSRAAECSHEGIVRILLERKDVNPDTPDRYGQTPPSFTEGLGMRGSLGYFWSGIASAPTHLTNIAKHSPRRLPRMGMRGL